MSKYKPGDKFLIEIEGVNQESAVSKFVDYKINGSDLAVYEGYLDKLKMIKPIPMREESGLEYCEDEWTHGFNTGWNKCIDKIQEGRD